MTQLNGEAHRIPRLASGTQDVAVQTDTMIVTGMSCGGCTNKISLALNEVIGVEDVQVSLASGEVTVRYDERSTSPQQLSAVVVRSGFGVDGIAATNGHDPNPTHSG
ncbi:MAG: heavy metal-associated domain-containing protein [Gammaproteobacteria bacterium]